MAVFVLDRSGRPPQEADDCSHYWHPVELDGVQMWKCLHCGYMCEDEMREEENDIEQQ